MRTPTLGYEIDTLISKTEIASVQLEEAITLFLHKNYVCALTLAGAAEVVFAGLLVARGEELPSDYSINQINDARRVAGLAVMEDLKKNEIFNHWNKARNLVKHHGAKDEEESVIINLFDEAYWMIKRALANASKLEVGIHNQQAYENWCIEELHL